MIALRYKKLASGKYSIYLDCYHEVTRKRSYRFLKLHVTKNYSTNKKVALQDEETMHQARLELQEANEKFNKNNPNVSENMNLPGNEGATTLVSFIEKELLLNRDNSAKYFLKHIKEFHKEKDIPIDSPEWITGFQYFLSVRMSENTVSYLLLKLSACFNKAIKQGIIDKNPFEKYKIRKPVPGERPYLSGNEFRQLVNTPSIFNTQIRDAFLFACCCGLRWDDVKKLRQTQVSKITEKPRKHFITELKHIKSTKTYQVELSKEASAIIEKYRNEKKELVFDKLPNKPNCNIKLHLWGAMAGIDKDVCFSMARNTYTMNLLKKGLPLKETRKQIGLVNTYSARIYETMLQKENSTL